MQGFESNSCRHTSVRKATPMVHVAKFSAYRSDENISCHSVRAICIFPLFPPNRTMLPFFDRASAINAARPRAFRSVRWNCLTLRCSDEIKDDLPGSVRSRRQRCAG
jgi:hypothetical protein